MIDIHTHLYWESYDTDRDEVLLRAHTAGVEKMFVIGCTVEESEQAVALAEKYPELFASVGLHPHFFNQLIDNNQQITGEIEELKGVAKLSRRVIAIGECGLDYYSHDPAKTISEEQKALQKEGFLAQIKLAQELNLPPIVHCRPSVGSQDAYEDMFDILKNHASLITHQLSCVLHCYMGDTEITKKFLTLPNIYFSFTANITYPVKKALIGTKDDLRETVKMIPLDRIFVETDCPFLAPQGKRGERNEPAYVVAVVEKIAEIQGRSLHEIEQSIVGRVKHVFGV